MISLILRAEFPNETTREGALAALDRFREAVLPGTEYGIVLSLHGDIHTHFKTSAEHPTACYVGTCPACGQRVLWDEPDGPVWTCPRDLADTNPFKSSMAPYSEEDMQQEGIFSQCEEWRKRACPDEHMPLHGACYEKGEY